MCNNVPTSFQSHGSLDQPSAQELTKCMGQSSTNVLLVCVIGAEVLARIAGGCIVRTATAALCLRCSLGSGGLSGAS